MKNLPEDDLFKALGDRLRDYQEQPDDDTWKNISTRIAPTEPAWIKWTDRSALLLALLIFGFITTESVVNGAHGPERVQQTAKTNKPPDEKSIIGDKNTIEPLASDNTESNTHRSVDDVDQKKAIDQVESQNPLIKDVDPAINRFLPASGTGPGELIKGKDSPNKQDHEPTASEKSVTSKKIHGGEGLNPDITITDKSAVINVERSNKPDSANTDNRIQSNLLPETRTLASATGEQAAVVEVDSLSSSAPSAKGETTASTRKRSRLPIRVYGMVTPMLGFQHLTPNSNDDVVIQRLNSPSLLSRERFSFGLDAGIQGPLIRNVSYIAGFSYYHQSAVISYDQFSSDSPQVEQEQTNGYTIVPGSETHTVPYNLNNVGISAGFLYTLDINKLIHSAGVLLQYEIDMQGAKMKESKDVNLRSFLNFQIIYRAEYAFTRRTSLFIQPSFSRSLLNDHPVDLPFSVKQSRVGVGFGLLYRF